MGRDISPVCNFIFGSIWTGLLADTVDAELTVRMVKGITHIGKTIWLNPWCFHHGVGLLSYSLHYKGSYRLIRMKTNKLQHGIKDMLHPTFLPSPNPNIDVPEGRPGLDGLT